jgi:phenylalanine-4-hydroxylase
MGPRDLQAYNFYDGKQIAFEFESGITVQGLNVTGIRNLRGELMLIQFTDCTVKYKNEVLFSPEMGDFDMAVGKEIVSAFAGAADYHSFNLVTHTSSSETIRPQLSEIEIELNALYKEVRTIRNSEEIDATKLQQVFKTLKQNHQTDWLLPLEIYELIEQTDSGFSEEVLRHLLNLKQQRPKVAHLIEGGLALLETKEIIN